MVIAVRRGGDGTAELVAVAAAGETPRERLARGWLTRARARGATRCTSTAWPRTRRHAAPWWRISAVRRRDPPSVDRSRRPGRARESGSGSGRAAARRRGPGAAQAARRRGTRRGGGRSRHPGPGLPGARRRQAVGIVPARRRSVPDRGRAANRLLADRRERRAGRRQPRFVLDQRLADPAQAAGIVPGEIDVDVVVMVDVRPRRQHGREVVARPQEDLAQKALLGLGARSRPSPSPRSRRRSGRTSRRRRCRRNAPTAWRRPGCCGPARIRARIDLDHRLAEIDLGGGWIVPAIQASTSGMIGQASVMRCLSATVPPASRVTRNGCTIPHTPGPSISLAGWMSSLGRTS